MALSFPVSKLSKSVWPRLVAPMLLASLGLHGLLLLLPLGQEQEGAIASADLEEDSIAITRVVPSPPGPGARGTVGADTPPPSTAIVATGASRVSPSPMGQRSVGRRARPSTAAPTRRAESVTPRPAPTVGVAAPPLADPAPSPALPTSRPLVDPSLGDRLMAYATGLSLPAEHISRLSRYLEDRFAYHEAATQRDTYNRNLQAWQAQIRETTGLPGLTPDLDRTDFSLTVPQRVCLRQPPTEVRLGVLTQPDGSLAEPPVVLRSSGYRALDQQAQGLVTNHSFPPADSIKAYTLQVAIQVDYGLRPCLGEGGSNQ